MSKERNKVVRINLGLPGSGKTTETLKFLRNNPDWVKISRDDFRNMFRNEQQLDPKGENLVTEAFYYATRQALKRGYSVVLDNCNVKYSHINEMIDEFNDLADIEFRYFDVPAKVCIERDKNRAMKVGEKVINEMNDALKYTLDVLDFSNRPKKTRIKIDYSVKWDPSLPNAVISDVDGTLSHMNGKRGPFDWKRVGVDDIDEPMKFTLQTIREGSPDTKIIIVSGRDSICRQETTDWLNAAEIPFDELFMRPQNDYRKDSLIKKEIYENELQGKYNIMMIYDDRNQVVDTWRELGLKCAQIEYGDF